MSDAEWKLWHLVRRGQFDGFRFRRQHPIGVFVADFICLEKRLIIELDGAQHAEPAHVVHDFERTQWLESRGYRVLRVWTNELTENLEGVLDAIWAALNKPIDDRNRPPPPRRTKNSV